MNRDHNFLFHSTQFFPALSRLHPTLSSPQKRFTLSTTHGPPAQLHLLFHLRERLILPTPLY
jgi:hypothetical protein